MGDPKAPRWPLNQKGKKKMNVSGKEMAKKPQDRFASAIPHDARKRLDKLMKLQERD